MKIREQLEEREKANLCATATLSMASLGRRLQEEQDDIRPCFQRDRDRILYSKAFRRLKDKTQVFLTPDGDHYRTRLTHTLEVAQNARTIARALRLNEDLAEAIAFGHDLGHTPFGHAGERALAQVCPLGFRHNEQSLRTVDVLELHKDRQGLNLTEEVRDGILNHEMSTTPMTQEGRVVRLSDKIAYIHHDMDDAIRGGIISFDDVPHSITSVLGRTNGEWLGTFIHDIVSVSEEAGDIRMSAQVEEAFLALRQFMFDHVYTNPVAKGQEGKAQEMVIILYQYYMEHPDLLPEALQRLQNQGEPVERLVCDHISSMTDRYAIARFEEIFVPASWQVL